MLPCCGYPTMHMIVKQTYFNETVDVTKNKADILMYFFCTSVYMNGVITVSENVLETDVMSFDVCGITFTKAIKFLLNTCVNFIYLIPHDLYYMLIMEHTKITFINNTIHQQAIRFEATVSNDDSIFPYYIFQYMESNNYRHYDVNELVQLYTISFSGNKPHKQISTYNVQMNNIKFFMIL